MVAVRDVGSQGSDASWQAAEAQGPAKLNAYF